MAAAARVTVVDYGVRSVNLANDLLAGWDLAILIDAMPHDAEPGALTVVEAETPPLDAPPPVLGGQAMNPVAVLHLAWRLGGPTMIPRW